VYKFFVAALNKKKLNKKNIYTKFTGEQKQEEHMYIQIEMYVCMYALTLNIVQLT